MPFALQFWHCASSVPSGTALRVHLHLSKHTDDEHEYIITLDHMDNAMTRFAFLHASQALDERFFLSSSSAWLAAAAADDDDCDCDCLLVDAALLLPPPFLLPDCFAGAFEVLALLLDVLAMDCCW